MDQAAEPVPAQNPDVRARSGWMRTPGRWTLVHRPVRAMQIVVIGVLIKDQPQVPFPGDQHPVQAVGAENAVTLCDLRIFVDQPAKPVSAQPTHTATSTGGCACPARGGMECQNSALIL
jgi:hypothetical protein